MWLVKDILETRDSFLDSVVVVSDNIFPIWKEEFIYRETIEA